MLMALALLLTAVSCDRIRQVFGPKDGESTPAPTDEPAVTAAPGTDAPHETDAPETSAPETEAPFDGIRIQNNVDENVISLRICAPEANGWGEEEPVNLPAMGMADIGGPGLRPGNKYDISLHTDGGIYVDFYDVPLSDGTLLVFDRVSALYGDAENYDWVHTLTVKKGADEEVFDGSSYKDSVIFDAVRVFIGRRRSEKSVDGRLLFSVDWDEVSTSDRRFPRLRDELYKLGEQQLSERTEQAKNYAASLEEYYREDPEYYMPIVSHHEAFVRRADASAFSVLYMDSYEDGEGGFFFSSYNFEPRTGRLLTLADVVTDIGQLPWLISEQLEYRENPFTPNYLGMSAEEFFGEERYEYAWVLDPTGLTIFFNGGAYDINSVHISYEANPGLVSEEFTDVPEDYTMMIPLFVPTYMDLHGDGELTEYRVAAGFPDASGVCTEIEILLNGTELHERIRSTSLWAVFVRYEGRFYIYAETEDADGRASVSIFDMSGRRASLIKTLGAYFFPTAFTDTNVTAQGVHESYLRMTPPTDPDAFTLYVPTDVFFPLYGFGDHHVGDGGLPVSNDGVYDIAYDTRLVGVRLKLVGEAKMTYWNGGADYTPYPEDAETGYHYIATDNESFIVIVDNADELIRVEIERNGDGFTVGGVPIGEVFEAEMIIREK